MTEEKPKPCNCPPCKTGLWCDDGERGEFVRGEDRCRRPSCGKVAWQHRTDYRYVARRGGS